jgi:hypothetical protein
MRTLRLSGEYDWSAYPAAAKALADAVPGASYTLLEGMGAFSDGGGSGAIQEVPHAGPRGD